MDTIPHGNSEGDQQSFVMSTDSSTQGGQGDEDRENFEIMMMATMMIMTSAMMMMKMMSRGCL